MIANLVGATAPRVLSPSGHLGGLSRISITPNANNSANAASAAPSSHRCAPGDKAVKGRPALVAAVSRATATTEMIGKTVSKGNQVSAPIAGDRPSPNTQTSSAREARTNEPGFGA